MSPRGLGLLTWSDDPAHFVRKVRPLFAEDALAQATLRPGVRDDRPDVRDGARAGPRMDAAQAPGRERHQRSVPLARLVPAAAHGGVRAPRAARTIADPARARADRHGVRRPGARPRRAPRLLRPRRRRQRVRHRPRRAATFTRCRIWCRRCARPARRASSSTRWAPSSSATPFTASGAHLGEVASSYEVSPDTFARSSRSDQRRHAGRSVQAAAISWPRAPRSRIARSRERARCSRERTALSVVDRRAAISWRPRSWW